ncbi:MAG: 3-oxoacyl-[acyl-carrier-protein] reductase, partial [Elusimicrobia bacterium]|nr:3-oxoacyl-[acyl-carrier-protein] reductase [Elusimicrobiota bacterium]MBD3412104.1 3-oxoacyl-[acyl-carrier-protein] reductase [Elusimicrobiota bacterium]
GKVAIITGSAQGIGKAIALACARAGASVVVSDIDSAIIQETADQIHRECNIPVLAVSADVSVIGQTDELVKKTLDKYGRIDVFINNAGITKDNLIMRMSEAEWNTVINVNLTGIFNCIRSVSRSMLKQKSGRIVNIASVVGQMGNAGQANYAASKGGVIALTKTCAREFASRGITVNAIAPGFIKTRMTEVLSDEVKQKLAEQIPLGRLGEPDDIAQAVLFLASDSASYITGQVLAVNGGMYM